MTKNQRNLVHVGGEGTHAVSYNGENGEINEFACLGTSEEIKDALKEISRFKRGKDYQLFTDSELDQESDVANEVLKKLLPEAKWNRYVIHNQELKKILWEGINPSESPGIVVEINEEELGPTPSFNHFPWKPFGSKPDRPIRFGKSQEEYECEWKEYAERMKKYAEEWQEYLKEKECYDKKVLEYAEKLKKFKGIKEKQNDFGATTELSNNENQWNWREFWVGCGLTLVISFIIFALIRFFKRKR